MKRTIIAVLILLTSSVLHAQTLNINNNHNHCESDVVFYAVDPTTCTVLETSNVYFVVPGTPLNFTNADLTAFPNTVWSSGNPPSGAFEIAYADISSPMPLVCPWLGGTSSCSTDMTTIGDVNCGYSGVSCYWFSPNSNCVNCNSGDVINCSYSGTGTWGSGMNVNINITN